MKLLHDWAGKTQDDVFADFAGDRWSPYRDDDSQPFNERDDFKDFEILLGSYTYEDYSGDAFVLAKKGRKLYEVNGGHCSCYGLEGQWEPEETSIEALRHRMKEGRLGGGAGGFRNELDALLTWLEDVRAL